MNLNINEILTSTMILFAVIDIIGSIPIILDIKKKSGVVYPEKSSIVSLILMVLFLFLGEKLIVFIGIDVNSFAVAGSIVLFALAFEMILGVHIFNNNDPPPKTTSIVPLAFPIIAGAGSMTTILSLRAEYDSVNIMIAIIINIIFVYIVLKLTGKINKLIGEGGAAILKKVFGIILLAIAIKLFSSNIKILFS